MQGEWLEIFMAHNRHETVYSFSFIVSSGGDALQVEMWEEKEETEPNVPFSSADFDAALPTFVRQQLYIPRTRWGGGGGNPVSWDMRYEINKELCH